MASTLKISDEIMMGFVRDESKLMSRSIGEQAVHWMRIGMQLERSNMVDVNRIRAVLAGQLNPDELKTVEEAAIAVNDFNDTLLSGEATQADEVATFFAKRQRQGLGVGQDESGTLVYARDKQAGGEAD